MRDLEPPRSSDLPEEPTRPADGEMVGPGSLWNGRERRTHRRRAQTGLLGQILIDHSMITGEQLEQALNVQQRSGGLLGGILVEQGALSSYQLARALSLQWGLPLIDLGPLQIDPSVVKVVPEHIARRHTVLAIERTADQLKLVISDPLNVVALDDVRLVTGLKVDPVLAPRDEIVNAIGRHYNTVLDVDEVIRLAVGPELELTADLGEEISVERLRTMVDEAPVVRLLNLIISQAIADRASDIHIEVYRRTLQVRYRVDGILRDAMVPPKPIHPAMVSRIKIMANMDIAEHRIPQDGRMHLVVEGKEFDLRVSTLPTIFGENVVMRILDQSSARVGLERLGFATGTYQAWESLTRKPYGMILVSGPTGSGKTTTLYSTLNKLNTLDKKALTVEDPVEYQLPRVNQVQVNPKAGLTFANGLRSFLRQDPNIIMVGEIRDRETAVIAIQASLTGHLVLSTVHTNDATSTPTRLVDMGIEPFLVSSALIGVLAQRLVRTICPYCKEAYAPPSEALHRLGIKPREGEDVVFYRGKGCDRCQGSGYRGRTGVFELMTLSEPIRQRILKGTSSTDIRSQAVAEGMKTLGDDGILKVLEGSTTVEELLRVVFIED